ncbi:MAG TPA: polysaccharide biosynthesis protein [Candidatus Eisenbacteria bacterium]|nr:polysaccharide biosynthesis protein [Candidatus Eisenbacteria bacterium]
MNVKRTPRLLLLTVVYTAFIHAAYIAALLLRFEGDVPARYWRGYLSIAPVYTAASLLAYHLSGLYQGLWRYASVITLFQILKGVTLSTLALVAITMFTSDALYPRSVIVMAWAGQLLLVGGVRFAWRLVRDRVLGPLPNRATRALVVGADTAAIHLIHEMRRRPAGAEVLAPVGFIDDDPGLAGHQIEGVKVQGTIADLPRVIVEQRAELVIVSDPTMPAKVVREIARFCGEAQIRIKTLPGLSDMNPGRPTLAQIRDVRIEDLLGRVPVHLDLQEVADFIRAKRVLVTGSGGSIGSELARQVAGFGPSELVLLDHAENGLYYVHNELVTQHPNLPLHPVVGNIQDPDGIEAAFKRFRPQVVFHAAAHKHVPLLEINPREAVFNNIVGTRVLVDAADRHGVEKFVLISTDKAVNPTSVMGASKRVCEMIGQSRSQSSTTRFVAVRFGNVLGSDGSVIPLFRRQLERGGPLTVTHPDARRYFMTIPEAVRLVLQAGAMGRGGEVYLLDMGEPVRILDLARQLIRLAGMREGEDVEIVFTGLRPGEKLYEELHSASELTRITRHQRILVWDLDARREEQLLMEIAGLERVARTGQPEEIKRVLQRLVPEYMEPTLVPYEHEPERPPVELPAVQEVRIEPRTDWREIVRQAVDTVTAGLLMVLSAPLWLAVWIEARLSRESDMMVRETRIGRTRRTSQRRRARAEATIDRRVSERRTLDLLGQPFECVRFRTDLGPMSRWLGRHGLDSAPFLLNVLRHDMTLVGPGPEKAELILRWKGVVPDYARRFSILPGVTGLAQVSECRDDDADGVVRRVHYDLYYVDNRSWLLDVRTMGRSFGVVLRRSRVDRPTLADTNGQAGGAPSTVKGVTQ